MLQRLAEDQRGRALLFVHFDIHSFELIFGTHLQVSGGFGFRLQRFPVEDHLDSGVAAASFDITDLEVILPVAQILGGHPVFVDKLGVEDLQGILFFNRHSEENLHIVSHFIGGIGRIHIDEAEVLNWLMFRLFCSAITGG